VQPGRRRRSIGSQQALGRSPKTAESIDATVAGIVDRVTRRMRRADRVGRTVMLRMRFDDFTRATRSHTLPRPTAHTATVLLTTDATVSELVEDKKGGGGGGHAHGMGGMGGMDGMDM